MFFWSCSFAQSGHPCHALLGLYILLCLEQYWFSDELDEFGEPVYVSEELYVLPIGTEIRKK